MILKFKRVGNHDLPPPSYAHEGDAGMDLQAVVTEGFESLSAGVALRWPGAHTILVYPGGRVLIGTGWAVEIPPGYEGTIRPRSGWAKRGLVEILGTIDSNYRGEIKLIVENHGIEQIQIRTGDRIAQLVVSPVARCVPQVVEELGPSERGDSGLGSTGM